MFTLPEESELISRVLGLAESLNSETERTKEVVLMTPFVVSKAATMMILGDVEQPERALMVITENEGRRGSLTCRIVLLALNEIRQSGRP